MYQNKKKPLEESSGFPYAANCSAVFFLPCKKPNKTLNKGDK
jgi:hypothetical protein